MGLISASWSLVLRAWGQLINEAGKYSRLSTASGIFPAPENLQIQFLEECILYKISFLD